MAVVPPVVAIASLLRIQAVSSGACPRSVLEAQNQHSEPLRRAQWPDRFDGPALVPGSRKLPSRFLHGATPAHTLLRTIAFHRRGCKHPLKKSGGFAEVLYFVGIPDEI